MRWPYAIPFSDRAMVYVINGETDAVPFTALPVGFDVGARPQQTARPGSRPADALNAREGRCPYLQRGDRKPHSQKNRAAWRLEVSLTARPGGHRRLRLQGGDGARQKGRDR